MGELALERVGLGVCWGEGWGWKDGGICNIYIYKIRCYKNAQLSFSYSRKLRPNCEAQSSIIHQTLYLVKLNEKPPSVVVFP